MSELFASVHILDVPYHADRAYDYFVPPELRADLSVGTLVCVPYGTANRKVPAVVTELHDECAFENVKPVFSLLTSGAALNEEMLSLCEFLKEHTLCTIGDAVRAAVPPAAISKTTEYYSAIRPEDTQEKLSRLGDKAAFVYSFIAARDKVSLARLRTERRAV